MQLSTDEIEQFSVLCSLFSRLTAQAPDEKLWQEFSEIKNMPWINTKAGGDEQKAFQALQGSLNENLDDIIIDYNRLFIGPDILKAPPWASVYLSEKKHIFSEETLKVKSFYEKYQMDTQLLTNEPADHISLEFRFMAILFSHLQQADAKNKEYILRDISLFLNNHFFPWVGLCLKDIKQNAQTDFYKNIAILASFTMGNLQKHKSII